jgi:acyl-CoA reductase-like NAD-dependent aldehyde dehydrogenase
MPTRAPTSQPDARPPTSVDRNVDQRTRDELREVLSYLRTASYAVPADAIQEVAELLQRAKDIMAEHMTADMALRSLRGKPKSGMFVFCSSF